MPAGSELLASVTEPVAVSIDAIALVIIVGGTVEAFVGVFRMVFGRDSGRLRRDVWLRYSRWLVAGLTFQLASDIIETSITRGWEALAHLGAIAVIRTFLNYFLERDMEEIRKRQAARRAEHDAEPRS